MERPSQGLDERVRRSVRHGLPQCSRGGPSARPIPPEEATTL